MDEKMKEYFRRREEEKTIPIEEYDWRFDREKIMNILRELKDAPDLKVQQEDRTLYWIVKVISVKKKRRIKIIATKPGYIFIMKYLGKILEIRYSRGPRTPDWSEVEEKWREFWKL